MELEAILAVIQGGPGGGGPCGQEERQDHQRR